MNRAGRKLFKNGDAIGHHFGDLDQKYAGNFEIVGVTEDTQYWGPNEHIRPMFFLPALQWAKYEDKSEVMFENVSHLEMGAIQIRTASQVPGLEEQVRRALMQINPNLTILTFNSFAEQVHDQFSQQQLLVQLTSIFGILALVLAAIGLYGVTAYAVAQRTNEIGVRMALGADRVGILQMVLRGAFLQAGIGLLMGIPAAILAGHFMAGQLYGVQPWDPAILAATATILGLAAFLAAVFPAQRAAGIEPMIALRFE